MKLCVLASGSKGNCIYVASQDVHLLVDVGLSCKETVARLHAIGVEPEQIRGILITHEHIDHIKGLLQFASRYHVQIYARAEVVMYLLEKCAGIPKQQFTPFYQNDFYIESVTVSPFEVSHDALCCVGFSLYAEGQKISIATDLGYVNSRILQNMAHADIVVLESNYDTSKLMSGPYPYATKVRIRSNKGHLSNEDCADAIAQLCQGGTKTFLLAHMSENNNTEEIALYVTASALYRAGVPVQQIYLEVAKQHAVGKLFEIKKGEGYDQFEE